MKLKELIEKRINENVASYDLGTLESYKYLIEMIAIEYHKEQLHIGGVSNSKRFERQDLLRAYQAGAIEQKDNNLNPIDVVAFGNLEEDSKVWYERYIA